MAYMHIIGYSVPGSAACFQVTVGRLVQFSCDSFGVIACFHWLSVAG